MGNFSTQTYDNLLIQNRRWRIETPCRVWQELDGNWISLLVIWVKKELTSSGREFSVGFVRFLWTAILRCFNSVFMGPTLSEMMKIIMSGILLIQGGKQWGVCERWLHCTTTRRTPKNMRDHLSNVFPAYRTPRFILATAWSTILPKIPE